MQNAGSFRTVHHDGTRPPVQIQYVSQDPGLWIRWHPSTLLSCIPSVCPCDAVTQLYRLTLERVVCPSPGRYTRRWLQVLSRRSLVPEEWLVGVISGAGSNRTAARTALIATRLKEEQGELQGYESMGFNEDQLDNEEKVRRRDCV